jgi:hypothetical protein
MIESLLLSLLQTTMRAVPPSTPGYAFVTTEFDTGNLSTWSEAGGNSGLAAGDAICRTEATAANLPDPTNYVAFLSDSNNDAYCRLHGLSGKKANNCGQATLPTFAGPWVRPDGLPFATLATLINDQAFISPAIITAADTHDASIMFSGTQSGLIADAFTPAPQCNNWTTSGNTSVAAFFGGTVSPFGSSTGCSSDYSLMCMHAGANISISYALPSGRQAFVTSASGDGKLSTWTEAGGNTGTAAGDKICQSEAAANGLRAPSSFKAWLSDSTGITPINAIDRYQNDGPWVRVDGLPIAASKADLIAFTHLKSLPITIGATLQNGSSTLTGTHNNGAAGGADCKGWTSALTTDSSIDGIAFDTGGWSESFNQSCDQVFRQLYCFSDLDRIFENGVEGLPY